MPYGHGASECQNRMIELGSVALDRCASLVELRQRVIAARQALVDHAWPGDSTLRVDGKALDRLLLSKQAEITAGGLNSKFAEKARIQASAAIVEQCARARRTFFGRIAHLDSRTEEGEPTCLPEPLLDRLPPADLEALKQGCGSAGDGDALLAEARALVAGLPEIMARDMDPESRIEVLLALLPRAAALAWTLSAVLRRFGKPQMDAPDRDGMLRQSVQIHLDKDCLRPAKTAYPAALVALSEAAPRVLRSDQPASFDLSLTSVMARGEPIGLRLVLTPSALRHLLLTEVRSLTGHEPEVQTELLAEAASRLRFRSLCLEIGPDAARITAVISRPEAVNVEAVRVAITSKAKAEAALGRARTKLEKAGGTDGRHDLTKAQEALDKAEAAHARAAARLDLRRAAFARAVENCATVIGVDPGRRDAIAAVGLRIPEGQQIAVDRLLAVGAHGREEMRDFFSSHALAAPERAGAPIVYANAVFLSLAKEIAGEIDATSRGIDARYRRITTLKVRLNGLLGRKALQRVPENPEDLDLDHLSPDQAAAALRTHRAMFREIGRAQGRKRDRLAFWARLDGAKRSWFGMLGNRLAVSALKARAGVAFEDGDWGVEERGSEGYRGRTENRVMASVAPRRLLDTMKARLDWSGVVWWTVASWHTSKTDHRYGVVDERQRKKGSKEFAALADGMRMDADEHAAETIGAAALLRPLDADQVRRREVILAQKARAKRPASAAELM